MKKTFINPQAPQILEIVDRLCLKSSRDAIQGYVISDYNSRIDVPLSLNQTGFYESCIDLYVDGVVWDGLVVINPAGFEAYAELRLGDQKLRAEFWPDRAKAEYELQSVYNIGSQEDEVIVEFRISLNEKYEIVRAVMYYDDAMKDNKYMTKWLLYSVSG